MSALAQRRTAAAAAITMLLAVLQMVLLSAGPAQAVATPQPTYGSAVVDGDIGEWDLVADKFADLIKAGGNGGQTEVLGTSYLRYDCDASALYVLALSNGAFDGLNTAWVKVYELGNDEANGTEATVYDGQVAVGFETVVPNLAPGTYSIEIHLNNDTDTASNARGGQTLLIECESDPEDAPVSVTVDGTCRVDDKEQSAGYVAITIDPDAGATVTFDGTVYTQSTSDIAVGVPGSYGWSASANEGYELVGDSSGTVTLTDCAQGPGASSATVIGSCTDKDDFVVVVSGVLNASVDVDLNGNGLYEAGETDLAEGSYVVTAAPGADISWQATAVGNNVFSGDLDSIGGDIKVEDCGPSAGEATATVVGLCSEGGQFVVSVSNLSNAVVDLDLNADGDTDDAGETGLGEGTYAVTGPIGAHVDWRATAQGNNEFAGGKTVIWGQFKVEECAQDVPVTVTVSGECIEDGYFARISVDMDPDSGATVDVYFPSGDLAARLTEDGSVDGGFGTWTFEATAGAGAVLASPAQGSVAVANCEPEKPKSSTTTVVSQLGALGDYVWFDLDEDGVQGADEVGVEGVGVELLSASGDVLATTLTDADGRYLFDGLSAGNYRVRFTLSGATYTTPRASGVADDLNSDVDQIGDGVGLTSLITLPSGVTDLTWDAGIVVEVKGIQLESTTTTEAPVVEPVTVETLPFTGFESGDMLLPLLVVTLAGVGILILSARREDEQLETVGGWGNDR